MTSLEPLGGLAPQAVPWYLAGESVPLAMLRSKLVCGRCGAKGILVSMEPTAS